MAAPFGRTCDDDCLEVAAAPQSKPRLIGQFPIAKLRRRPSNPRKHGRSQIAMLARSIQVFGFNAPILVDADGYVVAGEARLLAAERLGLTHVPVVRLEHLSEEQARAYMLADNKIAERSEWDPKLLAIQLKELSGIVLDFEIEATGFETAEIDFLIQTLDDPEGAVAGDAADDVPELKGPAVSRLRDLWKLGVHRVYCGDSRSSTSYEALLADEKAHGVFSDPPYNVKINGHISGRGRTHHPEFVMGAGEMSKAEFVKFLTDVFRRLVENSTPGSIHYQCMDWRHLAEILEAGESAYRELINLCVWAKTNAGMGSLYRSRHELVLVFKNGKAAHRNNVQLGRFGRNRTNVWTYPGANNFPGNGKRENLLSLHPTVKPAALVADAILDTTARNDIVLDPFLGSGTTIIAAERTGRRGYGIELDPQHVDTAIRRWERFTNGSAYHESGQSFAEIQAERSDANDT